MWPAHIFGLLSQCYCCGNFIGVISLSADTIKCLLYHLSSNSHTVAHNNPPRIKSNYFIWNYYVITCCKLCIASGILKKGDRNYTIGNFNKCATSG